MRTLLVVLALACVAGAADKIREDKYAYLDCASVKAGAWSEMETNSEFLNADGTKDIQKHFERIACVKADEEFVWIEESKWDAVKPEAKSVTLAQVRRSDGIAVKAWAGAPGGEAKETKMYKARDPKAAVLPETMTMTGTVASEKAKVGGKEIDAQKVTVTTVDKSDGKEKTTVTTAWLSADVPFRARLQDAAARYLVFGPVKWDKEPTGPAGMVRVEVKGVGYSVTSVTTGTGDDAKQTLLVK